MNPIIYKQADSRWGSKPYPRKGSSFAGNGCGCVSCVHVMMELDKYKNYTPESIRQWMINQGYSVYNCGTTHNGIPGTLRAYGLTCNEYSTMPALFSALESKEIQWGVLLFKGGSKGGICWTSGGHYVAFTGYKVEGGRHYFYTKDSGGRNHDGWYCYETQMKGLVYKVWGANSSETPYTPAAKDYYKGQYPAAQVGPKCGSKTDIKYWQTFLNWWTGGEFFASCGGADGIFGNNTKQYTIRFQKEYGLIADGIAGTNTIKKAKKVGKSEKH